MVLIVCLRRVKRFKGSVALRTRVKRRVRCLSVVKCSWTKREASSSNFLLTVSKRGKSSEQSVAWRKQQVLTTGGARWGGKRERTVALVGGWLKAG